MPSDYIALLDQMISVLQFMCNASLDFASGLSHVTALAIVMQKVLWLKCWSAYQASKKLKTDMPFQALQAICLGSPWISSLKTL